MPAVSTATDFPASSNLATPDTALNDDEPLVFVDADPTAVAEHKEVIPNLITDIPTVKSKSLSDWEKKRARLEEATDSGLAERHKRLEGKVEAGLLTKDEMYDMWTWLEKALASKCPSRLEIDESEQLGSRLRKKDEWRSVSLDSFLLEPAACDPKLSREGVLIMDAVTDDKNVYAEIKSKLKEDPTTAKISFKAFLHDKVNMKSSHKGGVYCFVSSDGHYIGLTVDFGKRWSGHQSKDVNSKMAAIPEDKDKIPALVILEFLDTDTSMIMYALESGINILTEATVLGLNCNQFDQVAYSIVATVADVRLMWDDAVKILTDHPEIVLRHPTSATDDAFIFWNAMGMDERPIGAHQFYAILRGDVRKSVRKMLEKENPLPDGVFSRAPAALGHKISTEDKRRLRGERALFNSSLRVGVADQPVHVQRNDKRGFGQLDARRDSRAALEKMRTDREEQSAAIEGTAAGELMRAGQKDQDEKRKKQGGPSRSGATAAAPSEPRASSSSSRSSTSRLMGGQGSGADEGKGEDEGEDDSDGSASPIVKRGGRKKATVDL
ncbi:hypothetical protein JCM8208_007439 [Rhodotorula glutinis]